MVFCFLSLSLFSFFNLFYAVVLIFSLCHRPRNCNLSNLCGRCKSLAPEIVSWFLGLCYSRKDFCRAPIDLHS